MIIWKKKLIECCKCHKRYSFDDNLFYHSKEYILICPNCNLMHKVDIQLLGKEYEGLKKVDRLNLTAINIGAIPKYGDGLSYNFTLINKNGPANGTGTITSVQIYAKDNMSNCKVAIFQTVSLNTYTTRSNVTIGSVPAGAVRTRAVNLLVQEGDLIGMFYTAGTVCYVAGGLGYKILQFDRIPCTNLAFGDGGAANTMSLYGTGTTPPVGWPHKWNGVTIGKLNGAVISKWNGIA